MTPEQKIAQLEAEIAKNYIPVFKLTEILKELDQLQKYCEILADKVKEGFKLRAENLKMREAIGAISSPNKNRHEKEEYWLGVGHVQCATVLATDTKIARNALKLPHTAHLARKIELMEHVVSDSRTLESDLRGSLKELDDHMAKEP